MDAVHSQTAWTTFRRTGTATTIGYDPADAYATALVDMLSHVGYNMDMVYVCLAEDKHFEAFRRIVERRADELKTSVLLARCDGAHQA